MLSKKNIYQARYGQKTRDTLEALTRTTTKIKYLKIKLKKLEKEVGEEDLDEFIDKYIDSQDDAKVIELGNSPLLDETEGHHSIDKLTKSYTEQAQLRKANSVKVQKFSKLNTTSQTSADYILDEKDFDHKNFTSVIEKIATVGINPTSLCTEVLIKILLKMELALNNLLVCPTSHDYSELFYRADYLKSYELNIHEIIKMPDDDIFYIQ